MTGASMDMTTDELYRNWHDRMVGYFSRTDHSDEAEDLTQELFVHYLQALCNGRAIDAPERWLWRAARSLVIDRCRHDGGQFALVDAELSDLEIADPRQPDPLEWVCYRERAVAASALLPELTAEQKCGGRLRCTGRVERRPGRFRPGIDVTAAKARHRHRALMRLRAEAGGPVHKARDRRLKAQNCGRL